MEALDELVCDYSIVIDNLIGATKLFSVWEKRVKYACQELNRKSFHFRCIGI